VKGGVVVKRSLVVIGAAAAAVLAGCGGSGVSTPTPAAKLQHVRGSSIAQIVLTPVGAQRIGVQTAAAERADTGRATVVIPYSAIVYDVTGQTYAFKQVKPLTYVEVPVKVGHVAGRSAYLVKGPQPGTPIVTIGAEELYGVQSGVLAQT